MPGPSTQVGHSPLLPPRWASQDGGCSAVTGTRTDRTASLTPRRRTNVVAPATTMVAAAAAAQRNRRWPPPNDVQTDHRRSAAGAAMTYQRKSTGRPRPGAVTWPWRCCIVLTAMPPASIIRSSKDHARLAGRVNSFVLSLNLKRRHMTAAQGRGPSWRPRYCRCWRPRRGSAWRKAGAVVQRIKIVWKYLHTFKMGSPATKPPVSARRRWDATTRVALPARLLYRQNKGCVKERLMRHLRLLICRVDDDTDQMTELDHLDLPSPPPIPGLAPLDQLEAHVTQVGPPGSGRVCALLWDEVDAQAVARYRSAHAPGAVVADGYETLLVARRFLAPRVEAPGVCPPRRWSPTSCPATISCPTIRGCSSRRACKRQRACWPKTSPLPPPARIVGWQTGEPRVLSATRVRTLVRHHGACIRRLEQGKATAMLSLGTRGARLRGVSMERVRRRPAWPPAVRAAVEATLRVPHPCPPEGVVTPMGNGSWPRGLMTQRPTSTTCSASGQNAHQGTCSWCAMRC